MNYDIPFWTSGIDMLIELCTRVSSNATMNFSLYM